MKEASPRARLIASGLAVLMIAGGIWLVWAVSDGGPPWASVAERPLDSSDLAAAVKLVDAHGIARRTEGGRLLVPAGRLEQVRGLLAYEGLLGREEVFRLEEPADDGGIWLTEAEKQRRRWRSMMVALSRLISHFPAVRRATVLLDQGSPRGLGRPAVRPTASVMVCPAEGARMSRRLLRAIGDLVAGSVSGMERSDVCVVTSDGNSYRFDKDEPSAEDPIERRRLAEEFHVERIRAALDYMGDVRAGVTWADDGPVGTCRGAWVSVPRSRLTAILRLIPGRADANGAELDALAAEELAKARRVILSVIGSADANCVHVDWHYDVSAISSPGDAAPRGRPGGRILGTLRRLASGALAAAGLLCAVLAVLRRRRKRAASPPEADAQAAETPPDAAPAADDAASPLELLRRLCADELRTLLQGEHPQTIALVLHHAEAATSAAVLDSLAGEVQVDVSRRIAALGPVDPALLAEVVRGLASRRAAGSAAGADADGVGKVAQILHHAGYATERAVLDGLTGAEPALAESIRRQMFVFEDVAALPRQVLKSALESLGSDELAIALRTAGKEVTERIFAGLPRQRMAKVRQEMERIGPVRLSDVEAAQDRVVVAVRRLAEGRYVSANLRKDSEVLA